MSGVLGLCVVFLKVKSMPRALVLVLVLVNIAVLVGLVLSLVDVFEFLYKKRLDEV